MVAVQIQEQFLYAIGAKRQSLSLWQDTVNKSPQKIRPRINLAFAHQLNAESELAISEYRNAGFLTFREGIEPSEAKGARSRIATAIAQILIRSGDYQQAGSILANAWNQDPGFPGIGINLSFVLLHDNRPDLAMLILDRTIADAHLYAWFQDLGSLYYNQSRAFAMIGRCEEAAALLAHAKQIEPDFAAWPAQPNCNSTH